MSASESPFDTTTEYRIVAAKEHHEYRGYTYWKGEPKWLVCETCGARELLTPEPSAGVDELGHRPGCPQRFAKSEWWREQFR